MGYHDAPPSYQDLLYVFKDALNRVLAGAVLPPICATFDLPLTLSLLDIAHAVREGRPTQGLVTRACQAFAEYSLHQEAAAEHSGVKRPSKSVTN